MKFSIHSNSRIEWQHRYAGAIAKGLDNWNIEYVHSRCNEIKKGYIPIILGPNNWKRIESAAPHYLMLNRKFIGHNVDDYVAISWNGFNGRGQFCVGNLDKNRLNSMVDLAEFEQKTDSEGIYEIIMNQSDVGRSTKFPTVEHWYKAVQSRAKYAVVNRYKMTPNIMGTNQHRRSFIDMIPKVKIAHVLNSTVSVDLLYHNIPFKSWDIGDPCYAFNNNNITREQMLLYLAHCQYHIDEISSGDFLTNLIHMKTERLYQWKGL